MIWLILGILVAALFSLFFSTLTYSLRDYSRPQLTDYLERNGKSAWAERTIDLNNDLIVTTAIGRLVANLLILVFVLHTLVDLGWRPWPRYGMAVAITGFISLLTSVAIPHALSRHAAPAIIGFFVKFLHAWRALLIPATRLMNAIDELVASATTATSNVDPEEKREEEIEQE